jgi:segregation and condensation protein B
MAKRKQSKNQQQTEPAATPVTTETSESEEARNSAPTVVESVPPELVPPASDQAWPEVSAEEASPDPETVAAVESGDFAGIWQDGDRTDTVSAEPSSEASAPSDDPIPEAAPEGSRLEAIIESLLFAADKPLSLNDLKRLLGERDGKKITAALDTLMERRKGSGIEVAAFSSGWHLRTNPEHANWVSRLLAGKPVRLSRAMLETLSIVAYRQPVTRPEIDDIRGVDCGPVLKTLLDRGLVRIIGKKEEVGRPMLYGTTPEFLRVFNLRDLAELPTLREFYELSAEDRTQVESEHGAEPATVAPRPDVALGTITRTALAPEVDDADPLLDELDQASRLAKQALGDVEPAAEETANPEQTTEEASSDNAAKAEEEPPAAPLAE